MKHPPPKRLARNLRQLADRIERDGDQALNQAAVLSVRGWPASVSGDGRGNAAATSTEHAALNPGPFDDIDGRLQRQLRLGWKWVLDLHGTLDEIFGHGTTDDYRIAGLGQCLVEGCGHLCRPDKDPNDRLKVGMFCDACYQRWRRAGRPDKKQFARGAT